jgi:hypothetical protein
MLMIQRSANGAVVFAVSGRLEAESLGELSALLAQESSGRTMALDLKDLDLVDQEAVNFLRACEGRGVALRNCPQYIRSWMAGRRQPPA